RNKKTEPGERPIPAPRRPSVHSRRSSITVAHISQAWRRSHITPGRFPQKGSESNRRGLSRVVAPCHLRQHPALGRELGSSIKPSAWPAKIPPWGRDAGVSRGRCGSLLSVASCLRGVGAAGDGGLGFGQKFFCFVSGKFFVLVFLYNRGG